MSARTKLNAVMLGVGLLVAGTIGMAANSWFIFIVVTVIAAVLMIHAGEVRIRANDHRVISQGGRKPFRR